MTKMLWKGFAMLFILGQLAEGLQLFPNNYKAVSYDYSAEIGSGLDEPAPHISGFRIRGSLRLQADPAAENAYVIQLADVKHEMYNGPDVADKETQQRPVAELASVIQDPFWALYDDNNMLIGLKFQNTEPGWSKNMKKAIATIFQVDFSSFNFTDDFFHTAYISEENTIQGTCQISYDVHTLDQKPFSECRNILVTKVYEPAQCTNFSTRVFNHAESFGCYIKREKDLITSVIKKLQFQKYGNFLYLDRFQAREMFYYFPWMASTEVHHVQISQSLQNFQLSDKYSISKIDFQSAPLTSDVTYENPLADISLNGTEDMTQGRHKVNQSELVLHVHDLIFEAADYLEENHLDPSQPDFKHGQVINRLLTNMANLNLDSMDRIFNIIQDAQSMREETARIIFLEMMPHVGTAASCLFIRNVVIRRKYNLSESALVSMIRKFPSYVRRPTEQLLLEMEELLQMDNVPKASVIQSKEIRKAAILSFASLVYKTFKEQASEDNPFLLEMYLQHINRKILDLDADTSYEMKLVHIMALRNIQIGSIERFLIPLINGDVTMDENTRLAASFAAAQAINPDKELVHNLFWPILTDSSNSVRLRIVAYDVLMSQLPDAKRAMNIHWFMENEQDEQLFNYHYTTIKSLAGLEDPCLGPLKALAKKILRLTKTRKVPEPLSGSYVLNYVDSKYDYGETFKLALSIDDKSGLPSMGIFEYYFSIGKRASPVQGIYWNTNIVHPLLNLLKHVIVNKKTMISNETIQEILRQTKGYQLKMLEPLHFETCYILHGRIVQVISVDKKDLNQESFIANMKSVLQLLSNFERKNININCQKLIYSNLYEMIVTSDIGIPVTFYNRQPLVLSNRIKIEFVALKSISNLILQSDNRLWIYDTYEMVVYNPIIDVFHSIQRISVLDLVYPIKVELKYDLERLNLNCRLFRSPDTKSKGMRFYASSLVTISNDKNNVLKEYCPSCRHYEVVLGDTRNLMNYQKTLILKDIGVDYSHRIFDCEKESNSFISNEEWYRILINEGAEFRNYPLYKFFVAVFHKRFNSFLSPTSGTCGSLITVIEDINNVSYVEINFNWTQKNPNATFNVETANLRISTNVVSTPNKSSIYFWDFNITSDARNNVDFYFIRKSLESKNLIGCIHFEKLNVSLIMNVDLSDSDKCNLGENLINATVKSEVLGKHKQSNHEINLRCSKDVRFPFDSEHFYDPLPTTKICLSKDAENKSYRRFDINILYKKIPILSEILLLADTIRLLFSSKVKYRGNFTNAGNIKLSLIESPTTEEINAMISTPFSAFEIALPMTFLTFGEQSEQLNTSENICHISPEMILRNNEHTFKNLSDWTLISGDYLYFTYAVFTKVDKNNNIKMELYHASHVLQIESVNNILKISFDGVLITNYRNEIALPLHEEFASLVLRYHREEESTEIQLIHIPIIISYAKKSLKITVISSFHENIEGLCTNARTR